ncbi:DUF4397 domain-containing protein [Ideonella sp. B508-1]|uniref:DUF4397 domain-containing protein n=1 Tax=Ideonella sp. B508-1 TaxID=137716 RepID=UPI00034ABD99|nr:DUF4397 domain-containing protein [Ideonella sp. B508-1]
MKKRTLLGLMAGLPLTGVLSACGGNNSGNAQVRLLNASPGYGSLDLYVNDSLKCSGVAYGSVSGYAGNDAGSFSMALTATGSSTELITTSRTLSKDTHYTVVAYGWAGALKSALITEEEDAADSGKMSFRVVNAASDAGSVDVYLTASGDDLASSTPVQAAVGAGSSTAYGTVATGTYRLRITAAGDTTTLLLDVDGVSFDSTGVYNLVVTPTSGGVLVDSILLKQQGNATPYLNTQARVRVISAMAGGQTVALSLGANTILPTTASPAVQSPYVLVNAGTYAVNASVGGNSLGSSSITLAAGSDTTLIVTGNSVSDAKVTVVTDDNRLPTTSGNYKIRVIHASDSLASYTLTFTVSLNALFSGVPFAPTQYASSSTSTYVSKPAVSNAVIAVTVPGTGATIYSTTASDGVSLASGKVYTMFVLDTAANNTPTALLLQER